MFGLDLSPTGPDGHSLVIQEEEATSQWTALERLPPPPVALDALSGDALRSPESAPALERFAPAWGELLARAVEEPGLICDAYTRFHGYSLGNRFAALVQCQLRGLEPGPLNSFGGWLKLGYAVKEGERALTLCMPLKGTLHREKTEDAAKGQTGNDKGTKKTGRGDRDRSAPNNSAPDVDAIEYIRAFVWKSSWFVLSQTVPLNENTPALPVTAPMAWDRDKALAALDIALAPFDHLDGNTLGFAHARTVAVSPLAPTPFKTLFHELAHVVLGHTTNNFRGEGNAALSLSDGEQLPPALIEVEAESVALLCLATLDLPGQAFCRGYIQHWAQGRDIPEKSAQRIFGAADRILAAGVGETRHRAPTAEEVGLSPQETGAAAVVGVTVSGASVNGAAPSVAGDLPPPALASIPAPQRLTESRSGRGQGVSQGERAETLTPHPARPTRAPASEASAWALHGHLQGVRAQLHPQPPEEGARFAAALRHVQGRDAAAAHTVRQLVSEASRALKRAFETMETVLESPTLPSAPDEEFDPFAGMAPGEVRHGNVAPVEKAAPAPLTAPEDAAPLSTPPLPPARQTAARRAVGRTLRAELAFERERFHKAAKAHELPMGRKDEKEMLLALAAYLGTPVTAKRDLSSHQWARCASAIETEDLRWGKPRGA